MPARIVAKGVLSDCLNFPSLGRVNKFMVLFLISFLNLVTLDKYNISALCLLVGDRSISTFFIRIHPLQSKERALAPVMCYKS